MVTAISRYGVRVIPDTMQVIGELERKGQLAEGPHVAAFESAFAARLGDVRAVSTSYGRMAFHYILQACDFPAGSEIVMPALTFWVMPEIARQAGLKPVFADVDSVTFNMTAESLERVISPRTVAIVPTHLWGLPCDMDPIIEVANRHRLAIIEDCAHALGAKYRDRSVGTFGDAAIFSLQTFKPLNGYGGGVAVVRDKALAARVADLAAAERAPSVERVKGRLWHGRVLRLATRPDVFTWTLFPLLYATTRLHWSIDMYFWEKIRPLDPFPEDYHERIGNVQAALALEGLSYLDEWTSQRRRYAARMSEILGRVPGVRVPMIPADRTHVFYQYCAYVPDRVAVVDACLRRGIDIETLHVDVCPDLSLFGGGHAPTPGARETTRTIQIPIYEKLSQQQLDRVGTVVSEAVWSLNQEEPAPAHQW
ncbi:MAG TPA: aminotransferase class I/II-fold pyridoxal phosphate-dependent enzyme [Gemmatimonadaceae bacterium]|nr:aminotransferase class I/II-fold pyridoxal phosphate-dependent enzyme [Gemmatimonadaceae bacterium]